MECYSSICDGAEKVKAGRYLNLDLTHTLWLRSGNKSDLADETAR